VPAVRRRRGRQTSDIIEVEIGGVTVRVGRGRMRRQLPHRKGRADFRHPALRLDSSHDTRRRTEVHAAQAEHPELSVDVVRGESPDTPCLHLAPPPQEVTHTIVDEMVIRALKAGA
jgi:hypothetical protein